ncbi:hypothetical protein WAX46_12650 [Bacillus sp. FJAT-53060]|uniref:hypothetical protein n=1 Tax=Bacillus sp. FJAT-53060 TaxID=3127666 RepID=UPI00301377FA
MATVEQLRNEVEQETNELNEPIRTVAVEEKNVQAVSDLTQSQKPIESEKSVEGRNVQSISDLMKSQNVTKHTDSTDLKSAQTSQESKNLFDSKPFPTASNEVKKEAVRTPQFEVVQSTSRLQNEMEGKADHEEIISR